MKISYRYFSIWRIIFGIYLAGFAIQTIPYADTIYSEEGMFPDVNLFLTSGSWPVSLASIFSSTEGILGLHLLLILSSVFFAMGRYYRVAGLLIFVIRLVLMNRNPLASDSPEHNFVSWVLLASLFLPNRQEWRFPKKIFYTTLFFTTYLYISSAISKSMAPLWLSGEAMGFIVQNFPLVRPWARELPVFLSSYTFQLITWSVITTQFLAIFSLFGKTLRIHLWWFLVASQVSMLLIFRLWEINLGMLVCHLFIYEKDGLRHVKDFWSNLLKRRTQVSASF